MKKTGRYFQPSLLNNARIVGEKYIMSRLYCYIS